MRAVDANGNGTATTYTADGLVRRTADSLGANGLKHVQAFEYDHDGNQTCAAILAQADADTTACGAGSPVTLTRTGYTHDGKPAQQTDGRTDAANPAKSVQTTTQWTSTARWRMR